VLNQGFDAQGNVLTQSGAGAVAARFGYDANTGNVNEIDTFTSGVVDGAGKQSTNFLYDPSTGLLSTKIFNDGTRDNFYYNGKMQLSGEALPGMSAGFTYNAAGDQTGATYTDTSGGTIADSVVSQDDAGRPLVTTETAPSSSVPGTTVTTSAADSYNADGQLASDNRRRQLAATTKYDYEGSGDPSPGSVKDVKLVAGSTTLAETDYGYDPGTKQLATLTVKGESGAPDRVYALTYNYGTEQIHTLTAKTTSGTAIATTGFGYNTANEELTGITVNTANGAVYTGNYQYYSGGQRHTDAVARTNTSGAASTSDQYTATYNYDSQDELSAVNSINSVGSGAPASDAWSYDGVGNRTGFAGGVSSAGMNQYVNFQYNQRGDCTNDGIYAYGWDALDRLSSVTPDAAGAGSTKITLHYDANGQLAERDSFTMSNGVWVAIGGSGITRYAWAGQNLLAEFDGNNHLLHSFALGTHGIAQCHGLHGKLARDVHRNRGCHGERRGTRGRLGRRESRLPF